MPGPGLPFTKMHGCGNDYVVVDARERPAAEADALARAVCDRRFGIGADGLLLVERGDRAPVRMRMLNPDGSEAEMCGNGLRCFAEYVATRNLVPDPRDITVETGAGDLRARRHGDGWTIDMGVPVLERADIPMRGAPGRVVDETLEIGGEAVSLTAVGMGNPHAVLFVADVEAVALDELGPRIETHVAFPRRTNVEIAQVLDRGAIRQRTWERGVGETLACGTGACAVAVAGALTGRTDREVTVHLRGGDLRVRWDEDDRVHMAGPAVEVFRGEWPRA